MTGAMTSGACMKNSSLDYSSINACIRMGSAFIVIGYFSKNVYDTWNQECKAKYYQKTKWSNIVRYWDSDKIFLNLKSLTDKPFCGWQ